MLRLIPTLDYEIHGNGHGSPRELMVEPTERLLAQCDRHGARLTIMADVAEIMRFGQHLESTGRDEFAYNDILAQLRSAVKRGHDVQLHIHSSYYNARFVDGHWAQDFSEYDLASLGESRLQALIRDGRNLLESLLRPVNPSYRCIAFRAANWSMSPSRSLVRALVANGIEIDTSVFKYGKRSGLVNFDYTLAHSDLVPWPVAEEDACRTAPEGRLLEFPIYSELARLPRFLTANRIYRAVLGRMNPLPKTRMAAGGGGPSPRRASKAARLASLPRFVLGRHAWKLDINQCSGRQLVAALRRILRRFERDPRDLPVVLIGHSKLFTAWNERSLEPFFAYAAARDRLAFGKFGDFDLEQLRRPAAHRSTA